MTEERKKVGCELILDVLNRHPAGLTSRQLTNKINQLIQLNKAYTNASTPLNKLICGFLNNTLTRRKKIKKKKINGKKRNYIFIINKNFVDTVFDQLEVPNILFFFFFFYFFKEKKRKT